jgi:hypothetical protein
MTSKSNKFQYCGVQYSIEALGNQRWRWEIFPPTCVKGLRDEAGEVSGAQDEAVRAAHRAIEQQISFNKAPYSPTFAAG